MLQSSFKTATELGIPDVERNALVEVLFLLEGDCLKDKTMDAPRRLDMRLFKIEASCGTAACLCGWANIVSDGQAFPEVASGEDFKNRATPLPASLERLFGFNRTYSELWNITPGMAATALRRWLETGESEKW
jgi:hypothetical protein